MSLNRKFNPQQPTIDPDELSLDLNIDEIFEELPAPPPTRRVIHSNAEDFPEELPNHAHSTPTILAALNHSNGDRKPNIENAPLQSHRRLVTSNKRLTCWEINPISKNLPSDAECGKIAAQRMNEATIAPAPIKIGGCTL